MLLATIHKVDLSLCNRIRFHGCQIIIIIAITKYCIISYSTIPLNSHHFMVRLKISMHFSRSHHDFANSHHVGYYYAGIILRIIGVCEHRELCNNRQFCLSVTIPNWLVILAIYNSASKCGDYWL